MRDARRHNQCGATRSIPSRSGFSLFELTMAMALIGVMAAIAAPRYTNAMARYRVDMTAKRIAADIRLAQSSASISSSSTTVSFNGDKHCYEITGVDNPNRSQSTFVVSLTADPHQCVIQKLDLGDKQLIHFNGRGEPSGGGSIVIQSGDVLRTITVDPDTGTVRIQ